MNPRKTQTIRFNIKEALNFQELTPEEKEKRGILARIYGPINDLVKPTRNKNFYKEDVWKGVWDDPIIKEYFERGGIPGEFGHPEERSEIDPDKIAIIMEKPPKRDNEGHQIAYFDILDTPSGRVAYTLGRYGYKFGVSSRGDGDVEEDYDGNQVVVPGTYKLKCFDLVLIPAVKEATQTMVESLQSTEKKPSLHSVLQECLQNDTEHKNEILEAFYDLLCESTYELEPDSPIISKVSQYRENDEEEYNETANEAQADAKADFEKLDDSKFKKIWKALSNGVVARGVRNLPYQFEYFETYRQLKNEYKQREKDLYSNKLINSYPGNVNELTSWIKDNLEKVIITVPEYPEDDDKLYKSKNNAIEKGEELVQTLENKGYKNINYSQGKNVLFASFALKLDKNSVVTMPEDVNKWSVWKHDPTAGDLAAMKLYPAFNIKNYQITGNDLVMDLIDNYDIIPTQKLGEDLDKEEEKTEDEVITLDTVKDEANELLEKDEDGNILENEFNDGVYAVLNLINQVNSENSQPEEGENKDIESTDEVGGAKADDLDMISLMDNFQMVVKDKVALEESIKSLQEKLAVSDSKVDELNEEIKKYKGASVRLSEMVQQQKKSEVEHKQKLSESLNSKNKTIEQLEESNKQLLTQISDLKEQLQVSKQKPSNQPERKQIRDTEKVKLTEDLRQSKELVESKQIEINNLTVKLNEALNESKKSRNTINRLAERYIQEKADNCNLLVSEIKEQLNENYTLDDVDNVCNRLCSFNNSLDSLPFEVDRNISKIVITESAKKQFKGSDEEVRKVDAHLVELASMI